MRGTRLVDRAQGSDTARERARVILRVLAGEMSISEACGDLGIGESRFHQLRERFIEEGVRGLEPGLGGRPGKVVTGDQARVRELEEQVSQLEKELKAAEIRARMAQVMPHLLKDGKETGPEPKAKARPKPKAKTQSEAKVLVKKRRRVKKKR